jgi:hypothetical protein
MFFPTRLYVILAWLPVLAVEFLALSIAVVRCAVSSGYIANGFLISSAK